MTKLSKNKLNILLITITLIVVFLGGFFTIKIINNINYNQTIQQPSTNNNNNSSNNINGGNNNSQSIEPTLSVPSKIIIDIYDTFEFRYSAEHYEENTISINIEDENIATINNNIITPISCGNTRVITTINTNPAITKYTELIIENAFNDCTYKIMNTALEEVSYLYSNQTYNLQITTNETTEENLDITYEQTLISNFVLFKNENMYSCTFTTNSYGTANFCIKSKYINKTTKNYQIFIEPTDFTVEFSNLSPNNNSFVLYLYNEEYTTLAQQDNIHNQTTFTINKTPNSNDEFEYYITNNDENVSLNERIITAKKSGTCKLIIKSKITEIEKSYSINIQKITPSKIYINNIEKQLSSNQTITIPKNTYKDFIISIFPIYSYGVLSYNNNNCVEITNNQIILLSDETQTFDILFDNQIILSIILEKEDIYSIDVQIVNQYQTNIDKCEFIDNILYVECTNLSNVSFVLSVQTYKNDTLTDNLLYFEINDKNLLSSLTGNNHCENSYCILNVIGFGTTTINFYNSTLNISKEITVIISQKATI